MNAATEKTSTATATTTTTDRPTDRGADHASTYVSRASSKASGMVPVRLLMLIATALLGAFVTLIAPASAYASNPQGFSPYLTANPRAFTLTGTNCTATVGFVFDNETAWQRIGGVTVACSSRHTVSAAVVVQYTPTQYNNLSTSAYYNTTGVTRVNATQAKSTTFTNAYGFGGKILNSLGVCRGSASHSLFYTAATVTVDGAQYNLTSWGYWNPSAGC